jgi:hypothetical protein
MDPEVKTPYGENYNLALEYGITGSGRTHFLSCIGATLDGAGASNRIGNVVAHMSWQNLRATPHVSMLFVDESPEVSCRTSAMPGYLLQASSVA